MFEQIRKQGRLVALVAVAVIAVGAFAACGSDDKDDGGDAPTQPAATATKAAPQPTTAATMAAEELGSTPGWGGGAIAEVFYTKDFFCDAAQCQAGTAGTNAPGTKDPVPSVWVLVPLFDDTSGLNFHCPDAGNCVAHPKDLDVSKIGLGSVIPLPPHSHIVDPAETGFSPAGETPWKVVVVGVNTRAAWDKLEEGKSIEALREVQKDTTMATADIPSNVVLFFGIR